MKQLVAEPGRQIYRLLDNPKKDENGKKAEDTPALPVFSWREAELWNEGKKEPGRFYGIFWTVNEFKGNRTATNLKKILSWTVDIDQGSKESQQEAIKTFLAPSLCVETKRGYQVYWYAHDASLIEYAEIQKRLVQKFGGDNNARDIARILRVPFHWHQKDPSNPFAVRIAHCEDIYYRQSKMLELLPPLLVKKIALITPEQVKRSLSFLGDESFSDRISSIDCEQGLMRISGTAAVCGESFDFKRVGGGNLNVIVDGKGTSVFIDKNKRIGSSDKGGPTIWQWINWYQGDHKKTYQFVKQYFPEVFVGLGENSKWK